MNEVVTQARRIESRDCTAHTRSVRDPEETAHAHGFQRPAADWFRHHGLVYGPLVLGIRISDLGVKCRLICTAQYMEGKLFCLAKNMRY
jgi:hypothetical protein